ncbi:MAG: site-specific integrase, partial [Planctomycetia bacterium]|nr:site-specific integrase [Planctomycetia bacterium]
AIAIVLAAFNLAENTYEVRNPLAGLKKPPTRPRLQSFAPDDEQALYGAAAEPFRDFLFVAIHAGLRPFCELARLTAGDVIETERGMMWRVYSSKTRKIPVRKEVADLVRKLLKANPRDPVAPLFANPQGKRWRKPTAGQYFRSIRRKLDWDQYPLRKQYTCYTCRHTFAHRMLSGYWNGGTGGYNEDMAESGNQNHSSGTEVKRFRCAILPVFAVIFCLGMLLGFVMIVIKDGVALLDGRVIANTILVGAVFCLFISTFIVFCIPVIVTPAQLAAPNWRGDYEAVAWEDIRTIKRFNFLGLRYLIINGRILLPLFLANYGGFLDMVKAHARREGHPLVEALDR